MKRFLVLALALLFAGATVFALDVGNGLAVDVQVKSGLSVDTADDWNDDTTDTRIRPFNNDAGQTFRTRLTTTYTGDWGGAKLRLQTNNVFTSAPTVVTAFGWANFLDKKVVVYGGQLGVGDDLWGLGKLSINVFDPSLDAITGVRVAFNVVDGLSFGFGLPFDQITYYNYDSSTSSFGLKTANRTLGNVFGGAAIGALYKSDIFSAVGTLRLYPAIDSKEYGGDSNSGKYAKSNSYIDAIVGAEVHPIDPLKVVLDARIDTRKVDKELAGWAQTIGYTRVGLKAQYDVTSKLNAHLLGTVFLPNQKVDADGNIDGVPVSRENFVSAGGVSIPLPTYGDYGPVETLGDMALAPRIGVDYKVTDIIGAYVQIGSDNILWFAGDKDKTLEGAGVYAKLGGKITLGTASIEIFDKINRLGATEIGDWSPIVNQFQIDFNWIF